MRVTKKFDPANNGENTRKYIATWTVARSKEEATGTFYLDKSERSVIKLPLPFDHPYVERSQRPNETIDSSIVPSSIKELRFFVEEQQALYQEEIHLILEDLFDHIETLDSNLKQINDELLCTI